MELEEINWTNIQENDDLSEEWKKYLQLFNAEVSTLDISIPEISNMETKDSISPIQQTLDETLSKKEEENMDIKLSFPNNIETSKSFIWRYNGFHVPKNDRILKTHYFCCSQRDFGCPAKRKLHFFATGVEQNSFTATHNHDPIFLDSSKTKADTESFDSIKKTLPSENILKFQLNPLKLMLLSSYGWKILEKSTVFCFSCFLLTKDIYLFTIFGYKNAIQIPCAYLLSNKNPNEYCKEFLDIIFFSDGKQIIFPRYLLLYHDPKLKQITTELFPEVTWFYDFSATSELFSQKLKSASITENHQKSIENAFNSALRVDNQTSLDEKIKHIMVNLRFPELQEWFKNSILSSTKQWSRIDKPIEVSYLVECYNSFKKSFYMSSSPLVMNVENLMNYSSSFATYFESESLLVGTKSFSFTCKNCQFKANKDCRYFMCQKCCKDDKPEIICKVHSRKRKSIKPNDDQ